MPDSTVTHCPAQPPLGERAFVALPLHSDLASPPHDSPSVQTQLEPPGHSPS